jgi:histidyl-tRNA synthetase
MKTELIRQKSKILANSSKRGQVKGFKDYTGEEAEKREEIKKILVETFEKYGFEAAETPVIEYEDFVKGSNQGDEVISDIFKLKDKGKRKLALRYEFTFQLKRIAKNKKLPYKRYQIGPVFRDEPVAKNRFRQFMQCDVDVIGSSVRDEAEVLALTCEALNKLGIKPCILINNRKLMNEILEDNNVKKGDKEQVLREIDKYDELSDKTVRGNLKKLGAENVLDCLKKGEKYFSQFNSYKEIISLMDYCRAYGLNVKFAPSVVRGLSYYNGGVFEVKAKSIKDAIVGGGSFMVDNIQATGLSFGLDRLASIVKLKKDKEKYLMVSLEQDRQAIKLAEKLRKKGKMVSIFYGKPSKALEYANSCGYGKVVFVGSKEVKAKKFKVKDMKSGKESVLKV